MPNPWKSGVALAINDLVSGLLSYRIWSMLAWNEIRQRYRRSVLGPFWLTISTGIMIISMGPLYAGLFGQSLNKYFTYLAVNIITWQLISTTINSSCEVFISSEGFIMQMRLPLSIYIMRLVWTNLIIFFHNLIVIAVVFMFYTPEFNLNTLLFPFGVILYALNAIWVGIVLGLLCARFRDVSQIVTSIVGVMFFLTPIMWFPKMLGKHAWVVNINPFYHFMELIRGPLLGYKFNPLSWSVVLTITILGYIFMILMFGRYRARIAYWL